MEEFTFFWNGPFCQWEESYFEIDGVEYSCAEQYMMAEKARLFEDERTLDMIMDTDDPATQKKLGRLVENFDVDVWQDDDTPNGKPLCWNIVYRGTIAKFSQNEQLKRELFKTRGTTLVEASPYDKIWGIGLGEGDPGCNSRDTWLGMNWLGEVLTQARDHLMQIDRSSEVDLHS